MAARLEDTLTVLCADALRDDPPRSVPRLVLPAMQAAGLVAELLSVAERTWWRGDVPGGLLSVTEVADGTWLCVAGSVDSTRAVALASAAGTGPGVCVEADGHGGGYQRGRGPSPVRAGGTG
ncbi:hypothetical protein GCM10022206_24910 [Streptomyces chiangmaiensis]